MTSSHLKRKIEAVDSEIAPTLHLLAKDTRRTYSQLLLHTFNTCDVSKLKKVFRTYCAADLHSVCSYEGVNNPYAPSITEVHSIDNHIELWSALFKSAPDFLFKGEYDDAFIDPKTGCCVTRSKFTFKATRILDLVLAKRVNAEVLIKKKQHLQQNDFITSKAALMNMIHTKFSESPDKDYSDEKSLEGRTRSDSVASTITEISEAPTESDDTDIVFQETSLFDKDSTLVLNGEVDIYPQAQLLPQEMVINCTGTFTVYLDILNKIDRYEFLYTAMEMVDGPCGGK